MKTTMLKILTASLICLSGVTFTHAADMSKAEMQKQIQVCMKKQQGEWVSYNYKGVIFNGTCQPNENGKLQFKAPAP
ncbi:hypothetical protein F935_00758 [Acinetobacter calcoaceticus ANC 3811]|uniref:Uncharacterized protein n=1 Tax=Acinetobacter calcoaceticus ANC 3811 TaxID=1217690 RepID=R8Y6S7_ACICA|nr:hypothetical protein [Acinetobacter calcoaceticus]EOQ65098.1 hypothetical protein F935_00758 [Acinetobacter calcoaceticus ANC 3811]